MARKKVIKRCPKGHEMEALWLRCPKCTGGKPGLKAGRSFEDATVFGAPEDEGANATVIVSPSMSRTGANASRAERPAASREAARPPAPPAYRAPAPPPAAHPAWAGPPATPVAPPPAAGADSAQPPAPAPAPAHPAWAGPPAAPNAPPPVQHPAWAGPPAAPPPVTAAPPPPAPPPLVAASPPAAATPSAVPAPPPAAATTPPSPAPASPAPVSPLALSPDMPGRSRAKLECSAGPLNGRLFMLALGVYRIGKAPRDLPDSKSIVVPNDKWMSKDHAVVIVEAGQVLLTDPGSTNGSFVNGEKVARAVLENGDELRLGESVFRFTLLGS